MQDTIGKIRGRYEDDTTGLAQWVARKVRNHDPMSERDGSPGKANQSKRGKRHVHDVSYATPGVVYCGTVDGKPNSVVYGLSDGRAFEITVRQIPATEKMQKLIAVGL